MTLTDFKNLQFEIIVLLLCLLISSITLSALYLWKSVSINNNITANSALIQARDNYYLAIKQQNIYEEFQPLYSELKNNGVIGEENRLNWVNNIDRITHEHKIPYLKYKINKKQKLSLSDASKKHSEIDTYKSTMTLQMKILHEGDLFKILNSLSDTADGLFNIQSCNINRQTNSNISLIKSNTDKNFSANCILNWYTIKTKRQI